MKAKFYQSALAVFIISIGMIETTFAQGTLADYQRAEEMNGTFQKKIYNAPNDVKYSGANNLYTYSVLTAQGPVYKTVDAKTFSVSTTATPKEDFQTPNNSQRFDRRNRNFGIEIKEITSPDGKWIAYIKEFNVYVKSVANKKLEIQLSFDGSKNDAYNNELKWAPNSKNLATFKVTPGENRLLYLIESSPDNQIQPILQTRNYPKPGDVLEQKQPALFNIDSKKQVAIDLSKTQNQYYVTDIVWRKDSRAYTFEYNQRGHKVYAVMAVNTQGEIKEIAGDHAKTYFMYYAKKYRFDVNDGQETIWMSERDGWNHLYLYDANGKVKNQITKGNWVVKKVINVDEKNRTIIFEGNGMEAGQDPYLVQYYKINFNGKGLVKLTTENGNHKAVFSDDYTTFIDVYSRIDQPQVTLLRDAKTGKILKELEKSTIDDLLKTGWKMPEVFTAKARDGKTDIWGMVIRPSNFDPNKKYPIIEYIYAGPHDSFVPKNFINDIRPSLHELAELGFIVVQCDGMGTSNRSKAFQDVSYKNLKDGGFPDRMLWIKALAKKYNYLDTSRVGIFGNSAGGQNSLSALLFFPEFYKVAVSSSGCHDNRMDKISWNEQFMGLLGPHYAENSNVDNAYRLQGKLLLIVGELDDNVDPSSTLQVVNQLIKNNKNFDMLFVPGMKHSLGGDYGEHKRRDFFVKHLLGVDPPNWTWKPSVTVPKS
jgi:dipeptidyl aminopeptidase/acylaminoacyl peptidase